MEKEIICPLKLMGFMADGGFIATSEKRCQCLRSKCAWWITLNNTENYPENHCAIAALAMKNADGRIII